MFARGPDRGRRDVVRHDGERYRVTHITSDRDGLSTVIVTPESPTIGDMLRSEDGGIVLEEIVASFERAGPRP